MARRTQVCPDGPLTKGIDVSFWQGVIDWQALADAGVKFAFIRAGDGLGTDTQFRRNWAEAKRVGILRGAYVFFRARHSGEEQARVLLRNLGGDVGELPPVLDIEGKGGEGQTREKILLEMTPGWKPDIGVDTGSRGDASSEATLARRIAALESAWRAEHLAQAETIHQLTRELSGEDSGTRVGVDVAPPPAAAPDWNKVSPVWRKTVSALQPRGQGR
jgi:hypothetical protein